MSHLPGTASPVSAPEHRHWRRLAWAALALLTLLSVLLRWELVMTLPLGDGVGPAGVQGFDDEPSHLAYVEHLLDHGRLPVETVPIHHPEAFRVHEFEHHQPPLYYLAAAGLCQLAGAETRLERLRIARALNMALLLPALGLWWAWFRRLGGERRALQALPVPLLAGGLIFHFSLCSNDPLSWLLLWGAAFLLLDRPLERWAPLLVLLAAAHWTKGNILVLQPLLLLALVEECRAAHWGRPSLIRAAALLLGPWLLALPWYGRNWLLYGEVFHLGGAEGLLSSGWLESLGQILRITPYGFFHGIYHHPPPPGLSVFNLAAYLLAGAATLAWLWRLPPRLLAETRPRRMALLGASMAGAWLLLALPTGFVEARLAFPALPVFWWIWLEGGWRLEERLNWPTWWLPAGLTLLLGGPHALAFLAR
jgi:hypothetical protein